MQSATRRTLFALPLAAGALMLGAALHSQQASVPDSVEGRKAAHQPFTPPPSGNLGLYPAITDAQKDLEAGLAKAKAEHKRVILDFGGDWCGDCQVLDIYFRQQPNADLLAKYYVKVNINIGHEDANLEIAHKYGVPVQGVPALAVLDSHGRVLFSQNKEFSDMRYDKPQTVTDFLSKWKQ